MTGIVDFAVERVRCEARTFRIQSKNMNAPGMFDGEDNPSIMSQRWIGGLTWVIQQEEDWMRWDADIAALGGMSGKLRIADPARLQPYYNQIAGVTVSYWDDGAHFSDGSGWQEGLLPPTCIVAALSHRASKYIKAAGLPPSIQAALRHGDRIEIRPDGAPATHSHFYLVKALCNTNSLGETGISIEPGLRATVRAGDQIVLKHPKAMMRLATDDEGEINVTPPNFGRFGMSLREVLPRLR